MLEPKTKRTLWLQLSIQRTSSYYRSPSSSWGSRSMRLKPSQTLITKKTKRSCWRRWLRISTHQIQRICMHPPLPETTTMQGLYQGVLGKYQEEIHQFSNTRSLGLWVIKVITKSSWWARKERMGYYLGPNMPNIDRSAFQNNTKPTNRPSITMRKLQYSMNRELILVIRWWRAISRKGSRVALFIPSQKTRCSSRIWRAGFRPPEAHLPSKLTIRRFNTLPKMVAWFKKLPWLMAARWCLLKSSKTCMHQLLWFQDKSRQWSYKKWGQLRVD